MIKENMPGIWGGIECSINRVGNHFKDQLRYSGHYDRPDDIECLAELGIKKIRYPVLWERHQPQKNNNIDWSWTDRQLNILRRSGMEVIAGLVHHGSGPAWRQAAGRNSRQTQRHRLHQGRRPRAGQSHRL